MKILNEDAFSELSAVFEKAVKEAYEAGFNDGKQINAVPVDNPVEPETIEHGSLILRKVKRKVSAGVYVRFNDMENRHALENGMIYGPVTNSMTVGEYNYNVFNRTHNRTADNVEVFEVVEPVVKTPNQQRYETIQRARMLVGGFSKSNELVINHDFYKNPKIEFFRNGNKTTCVITPENTSLDRFVGRSKCTEDDVYNTHIGDAIALCKALENEVPEEFTNAVQPDEFVDYHILETLGNGMRVVTPGDEREGGHKYKECAADAPSAIGARIIDDTNAEYETEVN